MLPKKRKFTPQDYDNFVVSSSAHSVEEDNNPDVNSPSTNPSDNVADLRSAPNNDPSNNNDCKTDVGVTNPACNDSLEIRRRSKINEEENVGIDLSSKRNYDPPVPTARPCEQYPEHGSELRSFEQPPSTLRRNSTSVGENYKSSYPNERCVGDLEGANNRQLAPPFVHQRHRYVSSPSTHPQYSTHGIVRISTPLGHNQVARPRSAASDATRSYSRSEQVMDDAQQSADGVQPPYPSSAGAGNVSGLRTFHSNTPVPSLQRQHPDGPLDIDLSDWVGHRILAKRPNRDATCHYYWPGVIHSTYEDTRSVAVRFDGEESTFTYDNVLSTTRKTIVSDVIPSTNQVSFFRTVATNLSIILVFSIDYFRHMFV